ncbi:hypothetical protein M885DRAFT_321611 [Pelagophyceae sp. CCMP2097]|nr:hypothetical protein M885DRAFT_321611 [Pelagophyceae sp. CCMP2097]
MTLQARARSRVATRKPHRKRRKGARLQIAAFRGALWRRCLKRAVSKGPFRNGPVSKRSSFKRALSKRTRFEAVLCQRSGQGGISTALNEAGFRAATFRHFRNPCKFKPHSTVGRRARRSTDAAAAKKRCRQPRGPAAGGLCGKNALARFGPLFEDLLDHSKRVFRRRRGCITARRGPPTSGAAGRS